MECPSALLPKFSPDGKRCLGRGRSEINFPFPSRMIFFSCNAKTHGACSMLLSLDWPSKTCRKGPWHLHFSKRIPIGLPYSGGCCPDASLAHFFSRSFWGRPGPTVGSLSPCFLQRIFAGTFYMRGAGNVCVCVFDGRGQCASLFKPLHCHSRIWAGSESVVVSTIWRERQVIVHVSIESGGSCLSAILFRLGHLVQELSRR